MTATKRSSIGSSKPSNSSSSGVGKRKTLDAYFVSKKAKTADTKTTEPEKDSKAEAEPGAEPEPEANYSANNSQPMETSAPATAAPLTASTDFTALVPAEHRAMLHLELETIDASWLQHLIGELSKPYFLKLKRFLKDQHDQRKVIFPPAADLYSWSRFSKLPQVRVVILGQDPYHGAGQAHGLAFSVRPGVRIPPSLLNMYKALERDFSGQFKRPAHGFLRGWAEQGVLLLNASLTVECQKPNSHAGHGWEQFTDAVISLVDRHANNVVFMLWGAYAQKKGAHVDASRHKVLKTVHPSPLSASRGFFDAGHFRLANEYLRSHGQREIDWTRLPAEEG